MNNFIDIYPQPLKLKNQHQVRSCNIKINSLENNIEKELWYELPESIQLPDDDNCDAYLLATLLPAMKLNYNIKVHGNVSKKLLENLTELQLIWSKWCQTYNVINIDVAKTVVREQTAKSTILAFSGGVDATFTAYRHAKNLAGYANKSIKAGILIHGFGIHLEDNIGFLDTAKKAEQTLNELNIKLFTVKTNASKIWDIHWGHYCGLAIASTLNNFSLYANTGIISSGESYDSLVSSWGSHPMTDHYFSTENLQFVHDGAGFNRTEKLKILSDAPYILTNLQFCYVVQQKDHNCGTCEKCLRTRINLLIAGVDESKYFDTPLTPKLLKSLRIAGPAAKAEWQSIYKQLVSQDILKDYQPIIKKALDKSSKPKLSFLLPVSSERRIVVKNLISTLLNK